MYDKCSSGLSFRPIFTRYCFTMTYMIQVCSNFLSVLSIYHIYSSGCDEERPGSRHLASETLATAPPPPCAAEGSFEASPSAKSMVVGKRGGGRGRERGRRGGGRGRESRIKRKKQRLEDLPGPVTRVEKRRSERRVARARAPPAHAWPHAALEELISKHV